MSIAFFDVETPNMHNDRICSIGVVLTDEAGKVLGRRYTTIDPECRFDDRNMSIHGLSPVSVSGSPTFDRIWNDWLSEIASNMPLVAHNASFDMSVICACMKAYGINIPPMTYADTLKIARRTIPGLVSYRLDALCDEFGIQLGAHHNAADDAEACMGVFWQMYRRSPIALQSFQPYVFSKHPGAQHRRRVSSKTEASRGLLGMLRNVIADGEVSVEEALAVLDFAAGNEEVLKDPSTDRLIKMVADAASDGWVTQEESDVLLEAMDAFVDPVQESCHVDFEGKKFCLTGDFCHGSKSEVASYIEGRGGEVIKSVTKTCNYVVMGGQGSERYAMGNYGSKVKKALDWQAKGVPVEVVSEKDIYCEEME